LYDLTIKQK